MAATASNLIMGPGTLYSGVEGAVEPADTAVATPPSAGVWTDVGGTKDGVTLTINQEYSELMIDQTVDVPGRRLTKRDMTLATNLAEPTLENLSLGANGGTITTGAGFKKWTPIIGTAATQAVYRAFLFDALAPGGKDRRIIGRRLLNVENIAFAYKKDDQTVFTASWAAHYVSESVAPFVMIDEV